VSTFHVLDVSDRVPYRAALDWQREVADRRIEGELDEDLLVLLEHEPVLTLGRNADEGHVTAEGGLLDRMDVDRVEVERGGDVTYHGPGQLVGYPIFDLRGHRKDLHWFLRCIEEALIRVAGSLGVDGFRVEGHTGVWVGEPDGDVTEEEAAPLVADGRVRKLASIGIHVSRWVSWHGFALNVTREPLENFRLIVPCGIQGVRMTSLEAEGADVDPERVRTAAARGFETAFGAMAERAGPRTLEAIPPVPVGSDGPERTDAETGESESRTRSAARWA